MSSNQPYFVIDFDSTFTQIEAMEELAAISLENDPDKELIIEKIKQLTDMAMEGKMPFNKSLKARIALLSAKQYHVKMLVNRLRKQVSVSFARNKQFFKNYKGRIYIVSGGFKEFIEPVVKPYFIDSDHVFANTFVYDKKKNIIGADEANLLSQEGGKVKLLKQLKVPGKMIVIGDGYTDYQIFEAGLADQFFAFTENIARPSVINKSEHVAPSLDEILFSQKLPMALSYPKSRMKVVLWGEETWQAETQLKTEGYPVHKLTQKQTTKEIAKEIEEANILLFSSTLSSKQLLQVNPAKLLAAGVWGNSVQAVIAANWAKKGIAIFNTQFAHARSLAELALLMMLQLSRANQQELAGKRLGIIGFDHCGSLLAFLASNLGMEVFYYDVEDQAPLGNVKRLKSINDILRKSNVVVLNAGKRFYESPILGAREIKTLAKDALLIHLGDDESISLEAVKNALEEKKLAGFGMDCLLKESYQMLEKTPNTFLVQNQRMATQQTQSNISLTLSEQLISFVNTGSTKGSINIPELSLPAFLNAHRFIHLHKNTAGVLAQINSILAHHKINVTGQYLKTNTDIGYVITDVSKEYSKQVLEDLKNIPETIRFRVLY